MQVMRDKENNGPFDQASLARSCITCTGTSDGDGRVVPATFPDLRHWPANAPRPNM